MKKNLVNSALTVAVHRDDLPPDVAEAVRQAGTVAWDIETSGLNWSNHRIGTCQICTPDSNVHVVILGSPVPAVLASLLGDAKLCKVFHHAMFDLPFMAHHWSATIRNVKCTKIASKILSPNKDTHRLKDLVQDYLGITLDKTMQVSDWMAQALTQEQVSYVVMDVAFLLPLLEKLQRQLEAIGWWHVAEACFEYLPFRVQLEILGAGDVFKY